MKIKKIGSIATAATLSVGLLATPAFAQTPVNLQETPQQLDIIVASTETNVSKSELIKKFKAIFPNKYDFLKESDFDLYSGFYSEDDKIRYHLSFSKRLSGNRYIYGNIIFAGENLDIEYLNLEPLNKEDAMFPAKISKEEAKNIALKFIQQFTSGKNYKFSEMDDAYYYPGEKQLLTEPVQYSFNFVRTENGIPIPEQNIYVSVLGNGEIYNLYRGEFLSATYDDIKNAKSKEEILNQIKNNLSVQLQYRIDYDYQTGERSVDLVYVPNILEGVHAITGQWLSGDKFQSNLPTNKKPEFITSQALAPKYQGMTIEQARKSAENLLKVDTDKVKLSINGVEEYKDYLGKEVITVSYTYDYDRGGYGTSLSFDKQTGDLIDYYGIKHDVLREVGEKQENKEKITEQQALEKAIEYLKQYAPSKLHHYSKPIQSADNDYGEYHFTFPRIVNGIPVIGDEIYISVSETGELTRLFVNYYENANWPKVDKAISADEAKNIIANSLNVDLSYVRTGEDKHYSLVYTPIYNGNTLSYLDAISGKWKTPSYVKDPELEEVPHISHPTAEKELNFFVENGYLEIADFNSFNADAPITKGEAINALVKSLTYYYDGYAYGDEEVSEQTFDNIGPDHPYYNVVEVAVSLGILDGSQKTLNLNGNLTREELAVWYVRALGLNEAAKHADIYKLNLKDAEAVNKNYLGYVTLANTLGIVTAENDVFDPTRPVTYAEFVKSAVKFAHKAKEMNVEF